MQVDYVKGNTIKDLARFVLTYNPDKIFIDGKLEWQEIGTNALINVVNGNMTMYEITDFIANNIKKLGELLQREDEVIGCRTDNSLNHKIIYIDTTEGEK